MNKGFDDNTMWWHYTKEDFWKDFDDQTIFYTLKYGFFLLSLLFIENNNLDAHLSNLKSL
jgi:hypothetical protein